MHIKESSSPAREEPSKILIIMHKNVNLRLLDLRQSG